MRAAGGATGRATIVQRIVLPGTKTTGIILKQCFFADTGIVKTSRGQAPPARAEARGVGCAGRSRPGPGGGPPGELVARALASSEARVAAGNASHGHVDIKMQSHVFWCPCWNNNPQYFASSPFGLYFNVEMNIRNILQARLPGARRLSARRLGAQVAVGNEHGLGWHCSSETSYLSTASFVSRGSHRVEDQYNLLHYSVLKKRVSDK